MELRQELLTDDARATAAELLREARFAQELPAHLWPEYSAGMGFEAWNEERREALDEHARPIWDEVVDTLARQGGYGLVQNGQLQLKRLLKRVEGKMAVPNAKATVLEYVVGVLRIEKGRAEPDALVGAWLDDRGAEFDRRWWKWRAAGDERHLYIPELVPVTGDGVPSRKVSATSTWESVCDQAETELHALGDELKPDMELRDALRFQVSITDEVALRYAVIGLAITYQIAFSGRDERVPFPHDFRGAFTVPYGDKVQFVRAAHRVIMEDEINAGKNALLLATGEYFPRHRSTLTEIAISIGAYRPRPRGRPTALVEAQDRAQFVDAITGYQRQLREMDLPGTER